MNRTRLAVVLAILVAVPLLGYAWWQQTQGDPTLTEVWDPEPRIVSPGDDGAPPSDAVVLFDGSSLEGWQHANGSPAKWTVADGAMTVAPDTGSIRTARGFGDCQLHIEWRTPAEVHGDGQEPGNSGVYLQNRYELQVLNSFENRTYANGQAGSIYKQFIPMVNASRGPGQWQSYDVIFTAPRFAGDGSVTSPAIFTVFHNGVLVQNHVELKGSTVYIGQPAYEPHSDREPLMLQDHGELVSFRNIWLRELSPQ